MFIALFCRYYFSGHRLAERGGQVEDAEILAGILLSLPTLISQTAVARKRRPFLGLRRPEWYA